MLLSSPAPLLTSVQPPCRDIWFQTLVSTISCLCGSGEGCNTHPTPQQQHNSVCIRPICCPSRTPYCAPSGPTPTNRKINVAVRAISAGSLCTRSFSTVSNTSIRDGTQTGEYIVWVQDPFKVSIHPPLTCVRPSLGSEGVFLSLSREQSQINLIMPTQAPTVRTQTPGLPSPPWPDTDWHSC